MSAPAGVIFQQLAALPARSRQGLNNLRQRLFQDSKPKKEGQFLRTSLRAHQPVWLAATGGVYTSMSAVYLTLRYLKRAR
ncbi:uncharacterized protein PFLUO_LOCUS1433 [Penicillium psychrofluorescens]|uniref:uncharacterized protein n=1 Tax=Penicillium psychrofluorescens TaxID=3158075 RepID=UPI003CCD2E08